MITKPKKIFPSRLLIDSLRPLFWLAQRGVPVRRASPRDKLFYRHCVPVVQLALASRLQQEWGSLLLRRWGVRVERGKVSPCAHPTCEQRLATWRAWSAARQFLLPHRVPYGFFLRCCPWAVWRVDEGCLQCLPCLLREWKSFGAGAHKPSNPFGEDCPHRNGPHKPRVRDLVLKMNASVHFPDNRHAHEFLLLAVCRCRRRPDKQSPGPRL